MKIEEIRELAQIMKENGLGMLELQEELEKAYYLRKDK